jgi:Holin of 3TMs, for gene-transfer release
MWPTLIPLLGNIFDKIFPDPKVAADAKLRVMELSQQGQLAELNASTQLATGQIETNKVEAASNSLFVAGWRPAVGWTCALAMFFKFIGGPALLMIAQFMGVTVDLPPIETAELWPILLGMLGLGALRTVEKVKNAN